MTTYVDQLQPYQNFKDEIALKRAFNHFRKSYRYELTQSDNTVLFKMTGYAVSFPGACKMKLETIAKITGLSVTTVKRAIAKAIKLGILKRFKTRKDNGKLQGTTVYQFQQFNSELQNEPQEMSHRQNDEMPCESKLEVTQKEAEALILLNPSLVSKDTNITDMPNKSDLLKQGLLNKIPSVLAKAISPFMNSIDDIYNLVGTIFRAKGKVDKSIQIEQHAQLYHKAIVSVFESQKRAARKDKVFNVFGVMYKAIMDVTTAITTGEAYKVPVEEHDDLESTAKQGGNFEVSPQWLIDQEQDPIKKARLIKQNEIATQKRKSNRGKEALPSWFVPLTEQTKEEPKETIELDIETEHKRIMQALGIDA